MKRLGIRSRFCRRAILAAVFAIGAQRCLADVFITTRSLSDGVLGQPYYQIVKASNRRSVSGWGILSGLLPPGLMMDIDGVITGTPTALGTYNFTVRLTLNVGTLNPTQHVDKDFSITIRAPLTITTGSPLPSGSVGTSYTTTLSTTGGPVGPDKTWSIVAGSGSLPPGLTLDPLTGQISGVPSARGTFGFTVQVTAGDVTKGGESVRKSFKLDILSPPVVITTGFKLPDGTVGQSYSTPITAIGGDGTYVFSLSSGVLPPGLTLDAGGRISGTPTAAAGGKTYNFEIMVSSGGRGDIKSFEITINAPACSFSITPTSATFTNSGGTGTVAVTTTSSCSWTATVSAGTPPFITILSGGSGTGNGTVTYQVTTNGTGSQRTGTITIGGKTLMVVQTP